MPRDGDDKVAVLLRQIKRVKTAQVAARAIAGKFG